MITKISTTFPKVGNKSVTDCNEVASNKKEILTSSAGVSRGPSRDEV